MEEYDQVMSRKEEGGFRAGVDFSDGDGTISHAGW